MIFNEQITTGFLIHDVSRLRTNVVNHALRDISLTRSQRWALAYIVRAGSKGITQSDLARVMKVGKVSLGKTIKTLEKQELVERFPDPDDARVKKVAVTDHGLDQTIHMAVIVEALNKRFWEGIDEQQMRTFKETLEKMMHNVQKMDDPISC